MQFDGRVKRLQGGGMAMRLLKWLIPDDWKDSLNSNAVFQWFAAGILVLLGMALVYAGLNGVRNKRLEGKHGRVYEGTTAQLLGLAYTALGASMVVGGIAMKW